MRTFLLAAAVLLSGLATAQKLGSRDVVVNFKAGTPVEDIEAVNKKGVLVLDMATGKVESAVLIKGFHFERALMEEHFNENYMESTKFPRATFAGTTDISGVNMAKDGTYKVLAKGKLTMHGVTREVEAPGTIVVTKGKATMKSTFSVKPEDYNIKIPSTVRDKIAKVVNITLEAPLGAM